LLLRRKVCVQRGQATLPAKRLSPNPRSTKARLRRADSDKPVSLEPFN
jgi:hypothetical protein